MRDTTHKVYTLAARGQTFFFGFFFWHDLLDCCSKIQDTHPKRDPGKGGLTRS